MKHYYALYFLVVAYCIGILYIQATKYVSFSRQYASTIGYYSLDFFTSIFLIFCICLCVFCFVKKSHYIVIVSFGLFIGICHMTSYDIHTIQKNINNTNLYLLQFEQNNIHTIRIVSNIQKQDKGITFDALINFSTSDTPKATQQKVQEITNKKIKTKVFLSNTNQEIYDLKYGDVIQIEGLPNFTPKKYARKHMFLEFNRAVYIQKKDTPIATVHSFQIFIYRKLFSIRDSVVQSIHNQFSFNHATLLAGLIIEGGGSIPSNLKKQFAITGLSHIVALSGFNVTIILEAVFYLLSRTRRTVRILAGGIFIILFAIMTGLSSPILRASIMSILQIIAEFFRLRYHALRALVLSGLLLIMYNPLFLSHDISFQLSIAATLGLIVGGGIVLPTKEYIVNKVHMLLDGLSAWLEYSLYKKTILMYKKIADVFIETCSTTISAQFFVFPIIAYYMRSMSLISPLANVLILPVIPYVMLCGFIATVIDYLYQILSKAQSTIYVGKYIVKILYIVVDLFSIPFLYITNMLLSYILHTVEYCSKIPYASIYWAISKNTATVLVCAVFFICLVLYKYFDLRKIA